MSAIENLVRQAMASGAASFVDLVREGRVNPSAPLMDAFGDFPAEFVSIRTDLIRPVIAEAAASALEGALHMVDDDESAQTLARLADQWRAEVES